MKVITFTVRASRAEARRWARVAPLPGVPLRLGMAGRAGGGAGAASRRDDPAKAQV